MSRRRGEENSVALFPFLDVLMSALGAMFLLLLCVTRQEQLSRHREVEEVKAKAVESLQPYKAPPLPPLAQRIGFEPLPPLPTDVIEPVVGRELPPLIERSDPRPAVRKAFELAKRELESVRQNQSKPVEPPSERMIELANQLEQLKAHLDRLVLAGRELSDAERERRAQFDKLQNEKGRYARRSDHVENRFAIVPYTGPNGTARRPIYLEIRQDGFTLQPEGVHIGPELFTGRTQQSNPLAEIVQAIVAELRTDHVEGIPYPLMVVRPDGVAGYYIAQRALSYISVPTGYELVEDDVELTFGEPNPRVREVAQSIVDAYRSRNQALASRGGFRADGGGSYSPTGSSDSNGSGAGEGTKGSGGGILPKGSLPDGTQAGVGGPGGDLPGDPPRLAAGRFNGLSGRPGSRDGNGTIGDGSSSGAPGGAPGFGGADPQGNAGGPAGSGGLGATPSGPGGAGVALGKPSIAGGTGGRGISGADSADGPGGKSAEFAGGSGPLGPNGGRSGNPSSPNGVGGSSGDGRGEGKGNGSSEGVAGGSPNGVPGGLAGGLPDGALGGSTGGSANGSMGVSTGGSPYGTPGSGAGGTGSSAQAGGLGGSSGLGSSSGGGSSSAAGASLTSGASGQSGTDSVGGTAGDGGSAPGPSGASSGDPSGTASTGSSGGSAGSANGSAGGGGSGAAGGAPNGSMPMIPLNFGPQGDANNQPATDNSKKPKSSITFDELMVQSSKPRSRDEETSDEDVFDQGVGDSEGQGGMISGLAVTKRPFRRDIVVECRADGVVMHPSATFVSVSDDAQGRQGAYAVYKHAVEEMRQWGSPGGMYRWQPHILFLVRPDGYANYYRIRFELIGSGLRFDRKLVDDDLLLEFPRWEPSKKVAYSPSWRK